MLTLNNLRVIFRVQKKILIINVKIILSYQGRRCRKVQLLLAMKKGNLLAQESQWEVKTQNQNNHKKATSILMTTRQTTATAKTTKFLKFQISSQNKINLKIKKSFHWDKLNKLLLKLKLNPLFNLKLIIRQKLLLPNKTWHMSKQI